MKRVKYIVTILMLVGLLLLIYYNVRYNTVFLNISIDIVISVLLAIGITYYLTQRKHDERKQKDVITSIIYRFQKLLDKDCAYRIIDDDRRDIRIIKRGISNGIEALRQSSLYKEYEVELSYIEDQFSGYDELIGEHDSDTVFLQKAESELFKYLMNMSSKLDAILVKLYN